MSKLLREGIFSAYRPTREDIPGDFWHLGSPRDDEPMLIPPQDVEPLLRLLTRMLKENRRMFAKKKEK